MCKIILASASPRRKELLKKVVDGFQIIPCALEEKHPVLLPKKFVKSLSEFKAKNVFKTLSDNEVNIVIGSDTIVVHDGKIMGKPIDKQDAIIMLKELSGRSHRVYTGVCLFSKRRKRVFCVSSVVKFYNLTDERIEEYVDSGKSMDKAGAYGIQDSGFVKKVYGSIDNVIGLPTEKLKKELNAFLKKIR